MVFTTDQSLPVPANSSLFSNGHKSVVFPEMDHNSCQEPAVSLDPSLRNVVISLKQSGMPKPILPSKTLSYSNSSRNSCKQKMFLKSWRWVEIIKCQKERWLKGNNCLPKSASHHSVLLLKYREVCYGDNSLQQ